MSALSQPARTAPRWPMGGLMLAATGAVLVAAVAVAGSQVWSVRPVWIVTELVGVGLLAAAAELERLSGRSPLGLLVWVSATAWMVVAGCALAGGVPDRLVGATAGAVVLGGCWVLVTHRQGRDASVSAVAWGVPVGVLTGLADGGLLAATLLLSLALWLLVSGRGRRCRVSGRLMLGAVAVGLVWVSVRSGADPSTLLHDGDGATGWLTAASVW